MEIKVKKINKKSAEQVFAGKIAEDALRESEHRFRNLVEQASNPICILKGPDMILEVANEPAYKIWQVGKEAIGKPMLEIFPEMKNQPFMNWLIKVYQTGVTHFGNEEPASFLHENGTLETFYFNFIYHPYREEDGAISGVTVFAYDVTDQFNSRKNNEFNELRYKKLIESLPVAVYTCDENGYLLLYNNAAVELWGRAPEIGKEKWSGAWKLYGMDGKPIPLEKSAMALSIKGKAPLTNMEVLMERPDGGRRYVLPHPMLVFDDRGEPRGAINTLIDITEIRKSQLVWKTNDELFHAKNLEAEKLRAKELEEKVQERTLELIEANKELQQSNEALKEVSDKLFSDYARKLIEASLDPMITISPKGKITDVNKAMVEATDKTRRQLVGSDFKDYFTDPEKASEIYKEVFAKGFVINSPLIIKDHTLTDVLFNGSVYRNSLGEIIGAIVVARDVTELKRIEKELIEARIFAEMATLIAEESKVKAETATLIAEDAVKAKQQFLSNMSHEIRTPMNAIIGFTKVVMKTDLSAKQMEYLAAIKTSGDSLIVLINDILDLAKVDAGKMTFELTPFKPAVSISSMLQLMEAKIQEKNIALLKEYDPKIPKVLMGDPTRLHQIVLNLLSNALKFTKTGSIKVGVQLLKEDNAQVSLEFYVEDTGIGIPEDKVETIFENFQQASLSTSRLFGGTGLGLAISKQLVEQQGGTIRVESKLGEGSKFSFILDFQKTTAEIELDTALTEFDAEIRKIKVLVVEDMALNQLLMKTVLDDFGFERDMADNGKIAIEKLKAKSYDIVLMDLQMPEMNGFEATEYIRNTLKSKIPIIALTADVTTVDLEKCKAEGMDDYIAKPIDERLLYSKIVGLVMKPVLNNALNMQENPKDLKYTDLDYLIERTKNNSTMMMEMISAYLEQTPPLITIMKQSLQNKDWDGLQAAVHKMIPSFSIMGMSTDFEEMAKRVLEFARMQQQHESITELVLQLEKVCTQACKELEAEFHRFKSVKA